MAASPSNMIETMPSMYVSARLSLPSHLLVYHQCIPLTQVRLRIPSTLRQQPLTLQSNGLSLPRASIELSLPHGYACRTTSHTLLYQVSLSGLVADPATAEGMIIPDILTLDTTEHHYTRIPPNSGTWSSNITNPCCSNICRSEGCLVCCCC